MLRRSPILLSLTLLLAVSVMFGAVPVSGASFTATSRSLGSIQASRDWMPPSVSMQNPGSPLRGTVTVSATASDVETSVRSVTIQVAPNGSSSWTTVCVPTVEPWACQLETTALVDGPYDLRAIAVDEEGNSATSATVTARVVDNTPPTVSLTDPGQPISGTIVLSAPASDALSGVATVVVQYLVGTSWTTACSSVSTSSPYTCPWNTTSVPNGTYDLRAVATDVAGNTATSVVLRRSLDNSAASVSVQDPGAFLRGTVAIVADASSPAGVTSVTIQRRVTGTSTWATLCVTSTAPYTCTWNTTTEADGLYDLQALLLEPDNKITTSAIVGSRRVDNTVPRGVDVQTVSGGTLGEFSDGDQVVLTYSEELRPSSITSGWNGQSQTVAVRLRDGGLLGGTATDDTIDVFTTTGLTTPVRVGSVNLNGDYIKNGKTAVFDATMVHTVTGGQSSVTITIGALPPGGGLLTAASGNTTMVWTPAVEALDLSGNPCSAAPVTESGIADQDF